MSDRPWAAGAGTAMGSLPGTDPAEAARLVVGELPELTFLPELPARGPGADMIGRSAALLVDLPVEIVPSGWRVTARPGRDLRRAKDFLEADLDAFHEAADGYAGVVKVQCAGPWTLAATLERWNGHRVVTDPGAVRDLAESLAEGLTRHLADVAARVPGAQVVLQVDEPSLPAVLGGRVPTPSGHGTVRAIEPEVVDRHLSAVLAVAPDGRRIVHCCARDAPLDLLRASGANALAVDMSLLNAAAVDALGQAVDAGVSLWLGVVPGLDADISTPAAVERLRAFWRTLGFAASEVSAAVVPTPACGLAGASEGYARRALTVVRETGQALLEVD